MIFISMLFVSLSACKSKSEEGLVIESSSVEFGSLQDRDNRELHSRVQISDNSSEPDLDTKLDLSFKILTFVTWLERI